MKNKYTPIKDGATGSPILLGDKVRNEKGQFGFLEWDDYLNRYLIKSESGGNLYSRVYYKVDNLIKNEIDVSGVECRSNPNKKKW